jgi:hypothetical protein
MYSLTRGVATLLGAGIAGFLVWLATRINDGTTGGYWAVYGILAAAGLTMALSQLLGGWTKGGLPRLSANVFLLAFIPTLIAAGWVVVAHQPHTNWFRHHILSWSSDIGILHLVRDLVEYVSVLAFGIGLVFGFSFDTAGPAAPAATGTTRRRAAETPARTPPPMAARPTPRSTDGNGADERTRVPEPAERR